MAFDVYVTFAGLCLFVDRGSEHPMEVLLPPTGAMTHTTGCGCQEHQAGHGAGAAGRHHAGGGAADGDAHHGGGGNGSGGGGGGHTHPQHYAVVAYPTIYEEGDASAEQTPDFREFDLMGGVLDLSCLAARNRHLQVFLRDVVDLTEVVKGQPADRAAAVGEVLIASGTACPISVLDHYPGGRWKLGNRPPEQMSTRIRWVIPDVVETWEGGEGLKLRILDKQGNVRETLPTLRPTPDKRIMLWIYHTLEDELPSRQPARDAAPAALHAEGLPNPGDPAEHFAAYYTLFPGVRPVIPTFVDKGEGERPDGGDAAMVVNAAAFSGAEAAGRMACVASMVRE